MTQVKHTPGPWVAIGPSSPSGHILEFIIDNPERHAQIAKVQVSVSSISDWYAPAQDLEANARLIAAAPDMLEALQAVVSAYENGGMIEPIFMARAAIARATGEKP